MTRSCDLSASNRSGYLVSGSVGPVLISLSWPILCSCVVEVLDAAVNVMWVGRELGEVALAALSNANLLWGVLFVAAFGVSMAGTVWVGRSLGEDDVHGAKAAVGAVVSACVAVSVICVLPMMLWAPALIGGLGTPLAARSLAVEYLRILLLSVPPIYLNAAVLAALQAAGDSKTGLYLAVASVAIDAVLNPLLIIGVPPFPAMGIGGAALATVMSQLARLAVLLVVVYRRRHPLRLLPREMGLLQIRATAALRLLREGGPMAVQVLWTSIEEILIISLVNRFGADTTAAYGAVLQLWNVILMPAGAVGTAITAVVAQNIGARRWDRVRTVTTLGVAYGVLATSALVGLIEAFGASACEIFLRAGSPSLSLALHINRDATWSLILLSGYMVWVGVLRATGVVWAPLIISASVLAVRFPVTLALLGHWQTEAIWWSFPASSALTGVLAASYGYLGLRRMRRLSLGAPGVISYQLKRSV